MKKTLKHIISVMLIMASILNGIPFTETQAAARPVIRSRELAIMGNACMCGKGDKHQLTARYGRKNITKKCTWKSSKKSVASVSRKGMLKGKKAGTAYITVKYKGKTSKKLRVNVIDNTEPVDDESGSDTDTGSQTDPDAGNGTDRLPDKDTDTGSSEGEKTDLKSAGYSVQLNEKLPYELNGDPSYGYTGEEFRPKVIVSGEGLRPLTEGTDYDLSYQNNVNVGYAIIIVTGKGNYKGEIRTVFRILPAFSDFQAKLLDDAIYVGETTKLEYSGGSGRVELKSTNDSVAKIDADGTITGLKPGYTYIRIYSAKDENHDRHWEEFGPLLVSNKEPSRYEFNIGLRQYRTDDGSCIFTGLLKCDAAPFWLDDVEYEVEDVTPRAWKNVYADLGVAYAAPSVTVSDERKLWMRYEGCQTIKVHAGPGIRAVRLTAKKNGTDLGTRYLRVSCKKTDDVHSDNSEWDVEMYRKVRQKVEAKLWTEDMSNYKKILAVVEYLRSVMHYPDTATVSKEYNPSYWEEWGVDGGKRPLYTGDGPDGMMMCFMGGVGDCWAGVSLLQRVAVDDLGLPPLYEDESGSRMDGEGFWVGQGKDSSTWDNPSHRTFYYRDAEGTEYAFDLQGMRFQWNSPQVTCEGHDCRSKIISLKD